jgi:hypothetical protein
MKMTITTARTMAIRSDCARASSQNRFVMSRFDIRQRPVSRARAFRAALLMATFQASLIVDLDFYVRNIREYD